MDGEEDEESEEGQEMTQHGFNTDNGQFGGELGLLKSEPSFYDSYAGPSTSNALLVDASSTRAAPSSRQFAQVIQSSAAQYERQRWEMQQYIDRAYAHHAKHTCPPTTFSTSSNSNHMASPILYPLRNQMQYGSITPLQTQMQSVVRSNVTSPDQQLPDYMIEEWLQQTAQYG